MNTIKSFNRINVKELRVELENAIRTICLKHGITAPSLGDISFDDDTFTTSKLTFKLESIFNTTMSLSSESLIGKRFKSVGRIFTIKLDYGDNTYQGTTQNGKNFRLRKDQIADMSPL